MSDIEQKNIERWYALEIKFFDAMITFSVTAIKGLAIANGGAVVALLAFLGNTWGKGISADFAPTMHLFLIGLMLAILLSFTSYLNTLYQQIMHSKNGLIKNEKTPQITLMLIALSSVIAAGSLWCFYEGSTKAVDAFQKAPAAKVSCTKIP